MKATELMLDVKRNFLSWLGKYRDLSLRQRKFKEKSLFVPVKCHAKCHEVWFELFRKVPRKKSGEQRTKFAHFTCITEKVMQAKCTNFRSLFSRFFVRNFAKKFEPNFVTFRWNKERFFLELSLPQRQIVIFR